MGPRPIDEGDAFYGREAEVSELFHQLQARRIVVLHSPSGAGKSSLVQAGLIPRLRAAGFDVWPPVRVNHLSGREPRANRYLLSAMLCLESDIPEGRQRAEAELAGLDLRTYIRTRPRRRRHQGRPAVLLFDQFEEILTADPLDIDAKIQFFDAVGEALDDGGVWALFVLREDYLGAFAHYRERLPTHMSNTFRLDMLTREGARDAALRAAADGGRVFDAVDRLIDDLSRVSVQRLDGGSEERFGRYVEPVHLQVVCRRLWDAMPADAEHIEAEHISAFADVSTALGGYFADAVAKAAAGDEGVERAVREWVGERLIAGGIRTPVRREAERSAGLENRRIDALVDAYLVRTEQRAGALWYELSHDRMVEPIQSNNAAWDEAHLHPMQLRARLWERGRRAPTLLLSEEDLPAAERWARESAALLTEGEGEFLARSVEARDRDRRARRLRLAVFLVLLLAMIGAVAFAFYARDLAQQARVAEAQAIAEKQKAIDSERRARESEQDARTAEAAARASEENARTQEQAATAAQKQAEEAATRATAAEGEAKARATEALAQKAAAEAAQREASDGLLMQAVTRLAADPAATLPFLARVQDPERTKGWRDAALRALSQTLPVNILRPPAGSAPGGAVAISADHGLVVAGMSDGRVLAWPRSRASEPGEWAAGLPWIRELVVAGAGEWFAWITADSATGKGSGRVWSWGAGQPGASELKLAGGGAWSLAMSRSGTLAVGLADGGVWVQRGVGAAPERLVQLGRGVMSMAWLSASQLAVATQAEIYLMDADAPAALGAPRFTFESGQVASRISVSADGQRIAVLTDRGVVLTGRVAGTDGLKALRGVKDVTAMSFVGADHALALGYSSGQVGLLSTGELPEVRLLGHTGGVISLAASADGARFVSLSKDGTLRVWPTAPRGDAPASSATIDTLAAQVAREAETVCATAEAREEFLNEAAADAAAATAQCIDRLEF